MNFQIDPEAGTPGKNCELPADNDSELTKLILENSGPFTLFLCQSLHRIRTENVTTTLQQIGVSERRAFWM